MSFTIDPGNIIPDYDLATRTVSWTLEDNTAFGTYTLIVSANDVAHSTDPPYSESVIFEYNENRPPQVLSMPPDPACISVNKPLNHWFTLANSFSDPDGDSIEFHFTSDVPRTWISKNRSGGKLKFIGTPSSSDIGNYVITLTLNDKNIQVANVTTTFNI